jgi:hypothetical protein
MLLTVAAILLLGNILAFSQNWPPQGAKCDVSLLKGTFGYNTDGFMTLPPGTLPTGPNITNFTPFALVGTMTFDGKGGMTSFDYANVGTGAFPRTGTGTYEVVDPKAGVENCAFNMSWTVSIGGEAQPPLDMYMLLARDGTVLKVLTQSPGVVVACSFDKK